LGGAGEDVLLAGTTLYDNDPAAVLAQWTRGDLPDYDARVRNLIEGGGLLNPLANPRPFTSNGSLNNALLGQADARDLFFGSRARDTNTDYDRTNEVFVDPEA